MTVYVLIFTGIHLLDQQLRGFSIAVNWRFLSERGKKKLARLFDELSKRSLEGERCDLGGQPVGIDL